MKKWMIYVLIGACAAGMATAEETVPWYKKLFTKNADEETQVIPPAPAVTAPASAPEVKQGQRPALTPEQKERMKAHAQLQQREGAGPRPMMTGEQAEKMKAQREELNKLGAAARNETDPARKEALIAGLRAKLTAIADQRQAENKKRLEKAEQDLPKLKAQIEELEKNKTDRIEKQLQAILSGEPFKAGESGDRKGKKAGKAPVAK
ncbi:MAG TPA: hypothetical protein PKI68_06980 [Pontiellaceae bacterium]|nr:hypothetical protein [Pontiellaceae bacterium]